MERLDGGDGPPVDSAKLAQLFNIDLGCLGVAVKSDEQTLRGALADEEASVDAGCDGVSSQHVDLARYLPDMPAIS